jgi:ATP/maltotriose-dependent transcriptional regulator MalT
LNDVPVIVRGFKNLQSLLAVHGEVERAAELVAEGRLAAIRYGDGFHVSWFDVELAFYAYLRGDWDVAVDRLHSFFSSLGDRKHYMVGPAHDVLGRIFAERGELAEALVESSRGLEFARSVTDYQQVLPSLASHACVLLRAGQPAEAGRLLDEYLRIVNQVTHSLPDAALTLTLLGREHEFHQLPPAVRSSRWGTAAEAFADGDYETSAARYSEIGAFVHEAEARSRLAHRLAVAGRRTDADREAATAAAFFRRSGASPRVADAEAAVRASA